MADASLLDPITADKTKPADTDALIREYIAAIKAGDKAKIIELLGTLGPDGLETARNAAMKAGVPLAKQDAILVGDDTEAQPSQPVAESVEPVEPPGIKTQLSPMSETFSNENQQPEPGGFSYEMDANGKGKSAPADGADLKTYQGILQSAGYYGEPAQGNDTGQMDDATAAALSAFQAEHGLAQTGQLDLDTVEWLRKIK